MAIDDASTDESAEIVRSASEYDSRIKLICHETNQGVGVARNTGLEIARGNFINIIDSDNFIETNTISILVKEAESKNFDVVFHYAYLFEINGSKSKYSHPETAIFPGALRPHLPLQTPPIQLSSASNSPDIS